MKVWTSNGPNDKHFWAFYYFCKRKGDKLKLYKLKDGTYILKNYSV